MVSSFKYIKSYDYWEKEKFVNVFVINLRGKKSVAVKTETKLVETKEEKVGVAS